MTESVSVVAATPPVETANGEIGRTVIERQLQNFALPGRNPFYMLGILPGFVSRYGNFMPDFGCGPAEQHHWY